MFAIGLVEIGFLLAVLIAIAAFALHLARRPVVATHGTVAAPSREWRLVLVVRLLALLLGIALAVVTWNLGTSGRGAMLALAVLGFCVLLGTAIGETVVRPRSAPGPRSASLTPRRVRDYLPWTAPLVTVQVVLLVAIMVFASVTASDDSLGRSRALACSAGPLTQAHSPYPGLFYSVPLAAALVIVLATAVLAARRVVDRPRGMATTEQGDDRLRRNSLGMVFAATGVAVGFPLSGLAVTTGGAMTSLSSGEPSCAPGWYVPVGIGLIVLGLLALGTVSLLLGRLVLVKSPRA